MTTRLPEFQSYGDYNSDNYGAHTIQLILPGLTLFYSYKTIVAYADRMDGRVVCENRWSTTTGKHLNMIDGGNKKSRKDGATFDAMLQAALERAFNRND